MLKNLYREFQQILFGYWVPFVSTTDNQIELLLEQLDLDSNSVFIEIGCWDGRVISRVADSFQNTKCIWYESSPYPYSIAQQYNKRKNIQIHKQSIFDTSLHDATHMYLYMVPYMTHRIYKKIQTECKPGTMVYIKSHTIPGMLIHKTIPLSEKNNLNIYII